MVRRWQSSRHDPLVAAAWGNYRSHGGCSAPTPSCGESTMAIRRACSNRCDPRFCLDDGCRAYLGRLDRSLSFPVLFCWVFGGVLAGIAAAWINHPRSWPTGLLLVGIALAALGRLNAYAQAPEPQMRVVVKPGATSDEVQRVWNEVLGHPTGRGNEHYMLREFSSVSAGGYEGESAILRVAIRKSTNQRQRDSLVALIRRSPLVVRIDTVPARVINH
jgi:hypothetical protein